jgi:cytochrome bd-type quinol oxidase subunit 2
MAHSGPAPRRTRAWVLITVLLLVAVLGTLIVPIYARATPALGAFPFFYWYQLLWVPVVSVLTAACYLISVRVGRRPLSPGGSGSGPGSASSPGTGSGEAA